VVRAPTHGTGIDFQHNVIVVDPVSYVSNNNAEYTGGSIT